jgi:hypothetical protein
VRCLDENVVIEFLEGVLPEPAHAAVERHVDACGGCRRLLADLARVAEEDPTLTEEQGVLHPGQLLAGRFLVRRLIGSGSMGSVYAAFDQQLGEEVAIKVLRKELSATEHLHHLHHEVGVSRRVTHPNVCRVHDVGSSGGTHFITMAFVEGEPLDEVLSHGRVRHGYALSVLAQICDALEAAHAQGIVHRDLKPSNITVDAAGKVTVMDFGLARDLRGDISSRTGMLIGTPAYWSPEQARGEKATERSDVFALGMIACDLFGATKPRFGDGDRVLRELPPAIGRVVAQCLKVDPRERPFPRTVKERLEAASRPRIASVRTAVVLGAIGLIGASIAALAIESFEPQRFEAPVVAKAPSLEDAEVQMLLRRLDGVEETRRAKGLLVSDVKGHAALMLEARRALEKKDMEGARSAIATMEVRLERMAIDAELVGTKMLRMRRLTRSIDESDRVEEIFSEVRDRFSAGDFTGANAHLNELLPLVEENL